MLIFRCVLVLLVVSAVPVTAQETAHLWIDTNGGTCTRNGSPSAYSDAAACGSFDAANDVAQNGDTVLIKAGSYSSQTLTGFNSRTANATFRPAVGETVTMPTMQFATDGDTTDGAKFLLIDGDGLRLQLTGTDMNFMGNTSDVEVRSVKGANFGFFGPAQTKNNISVRNGEWGPCNMDDSPSNCNIKLDGSNTNILIEGNYIHDLKCSGHDCTDCTDGTPACDIHGEAIIVFKGANGLTIRGNKFHDNEFYNIFMQNIGGGGGNITNVTIENNWFGQPGDGSGTAYARFTAVALSPRNAAFSNFLVRFNSFNGSAGISWNDDGDGTTYTNMRATGNLIGVRECYGSVTYRYNVYDETLTCSGTGEVALNAALPYVNTGNTSALDYHLTGADTSIDNRVPTSVTDGCAALDYDGIARPIDTNCDAGADERGEGGGPPSPSNGQVRLRIRRNLALIFKPFGSGTDWGA